MSLDRRSVKKRGSFYLSFKLTPDLGKVNAAAIHAAAIHSSASRLGLEPWCANGGGPLTTGCLPEPREYETRFPCLQTREARCRMLSIDYKHVRWVLPGEALRGP